MNAVMYVFALLSLCAGSVARAEPLYQSGWLQDSRGSMDRVNRCAVDLATNILSTGKQVESVEWRGRYLVIHLPLAKENIRRIQVLDREGKPIPQFDEMQLLARAHADSDRNATTLKLYLKRPAGFDFRILAYLQ